MPTRYGVRRRLANGAASQKTYRIGVFWGDYGPKVAQIASKWHRFTHKHGQETLVETRLQVIDKYTLFHAPVGSGLYCLYGCKRVFGRIQPPI
jgi:hypothetical protein